MSSYASHLHPLSALLAVTCLVLAGAAQAQSAPVATPVASAPAARVEPPLPSVSLVRPRSETWPDHVEIKGDVMPWQEIRVTAEIGGLRLTRVLVAVGDAVRKGQVLAQLDTASVEAELENLNAQLVEADAAQKQAEATLSRAKRLVDSGGVSQQELTQYETQKQTTTARLAAARARLRTQQLKLESARLVAPDDGIVSASSADEGDIVRPGAELFRLIRQGRLEWRAEVPGETLLKLEPGQKVTLSSPFGDEVQGRVRRLSPTIDLRTRMGLAYVDLPADTRFKAGLRVSGMLVTQRKALVLPAAAIQHGDDADVVFTVDAGKLRAIKVQQGRSQGEDREIVSGLSPNMRVVARGVHNLQAGAAVRVVDPSGDDNRP